MMMKKMILSILGIFLLLSAPAAFADRRERPSIKDVDRVATYYESLGFERRSPVRPSHLTGYAKRKYEVLWDSSSCQKDGNCPNAYFIHAYGISTFAVVMQFDQTMRIYVYTDEGASITTCSARGTGEIHCRRYR